MTLAAPPLLLFAEDFDEPVAPAPAIIEEPEIIEPVYSLAELDAARAEAAEAARAALHAELADAHQLQVRLALAEIAQAMGDARRAAERLAETHATAFTGLLIDLLRSALPSVCARHGAAEARAMLQLLRPSLMAEPRLVIQLHPATADALAQDLAELRATLPGDVEMAAADPSLQPGDVRVAWRNGSAVRDTRTLLAAIDDALGAAGLLTESRELLDAG